MNSHLLYSCFFALFLLHLSSCKNTGSTQEESTNTEQTMSTSSTAFGGLALYTIRDTLAKNPKEMLREVAATGYKYVEAAGYADGKYYGMTPTEFKNYLNELGLEPVSSHHGDVTLDNADAMIAADKEVGFKYFVIPIPPMGHFKYDGKTNTLSMSDEVETVSNIINTIAEKCTAAGLQCLYHNHNFEFEKNAKGIVPMDYFIEHSDPKHLNFEIDLYWATKAGADPVAYFNKAPGRFKAWHVKDMDDQGRFAPVGTGNIDFAKILEHKDLSGMEYYFVEQDATFDQTPMEAIKISHQALSEIGFK
ncbi:MAG TPA: sugar phosphate isomerase/epimerase [Saprospiraceae bacterium]|nr:sugar phosphate isomerase/epimerase [Saprospiraceae bacterium]HMQ81333.1 sugar phosphate isomerase/epimerase [Saprospiraceae bacterium]